MTREMDVLLAMPPADRIALARELLAGTGKCVALEVYDPFVGAHSWDDLLRGRAAKPGEE